MGHHHNHRDPEKDKKEKKLKLYALIFFGLGIVALIPYLALELFPFVTSIQAHHKINISTVCYTLLRLMLVVIPVVIILPSRVYRSKIEKTNLLGKVFALVSFFFFFGMVADIMSYNIFGGYADFGNDPVMIKMLCGYIGIGGIVFCFLQGVFYLLLSKKINGHKKDVVLLFAIAYLTYLVLPFVLMSINDIQLFTKDWYTWFGKNVFLWLSNMFVLVGLIIATGSRRMWGQLIW
ncbi:MAG: hypothetical protein UIM24_02680 [Clostridia bacterium]|nr:hypothetical protein [Clostridia bacterium]